MAGAHVVEAVATVPCLVCGAPARWLDPGVALWFGADCGICGGVVRADAGGAAELARLTPQQRDTLTTAVRRILREVRGPLDMAAHIVEGLASGSLL